MVWRWQPGVRSNERAVANARAATTDLSRRRVERDEVELYLRGRYADLPRRPEATALDASGRAAAR